MKRSGLPLRKLSLAKDQYVNGVGNNIAVVDAQTTLENSRQSYVTALVQYHMARVNYYSALGKTESFHLEHVVIKGRETVMVSKIVKKFHELNQKFWKIAAALTLLPLLLLGCGLRYIFTHESTDDAFIEGDVTVISPKVSGHIEKVYVRDNQPVKAQDPLCDIDGRDYQTSL